MSEILPTPQLIEKKCSECERVFKVLERSKQTICSRYCEYELLRRTGNAKDIYRFKKQTCIVRTLPKYAKGLNLSFTSKKGEA